MFFASWPCCILLHPVWVRLMQIQAAVLLYKPVPCMCGPSHSGLHQAASPEELIQLRLGPCFRGCARVWQAVTALCLPAATMQPSGQPRASTPLPCQTSSW